MQLNLFQWDIVETGNGFACLARLDFEPARRHFDRVLEAYPNHLNARKGMEAIRYWQPVFEELSRLPVKEGVEFFWQRTRAFVFGDREADRELRANLLRHLLELMEQGGVDDQPPELCRGYLLLQLGEYVAAEQQLRRLIDLIPGEGLLYGYLADALWHQGRREIANALYAAALLLDPERMAGHAIRNPRLVNVIGEHGAPLAPIYGYFQGVLPLVDQEAANGDGACSAYVLLREAERARHRRDHGAMVAARSALHRVEPALFADYLRFVEAT